MPFLILCRENSAGILCCFPFSAAAYPGFTWTWRDHHPAPWLFLARHIHVWCHHRDLCGASALFPLGYGYLHPVWALLSLGSFTSILEPLCLVNRTVGLLLLQHKFYWNCLLPQAYVSPLSVFHGLSQNQDLWELNDCWISMSLSNHCCTVYMIRPDYEFIEMSLSHNGDQLKPVLLTHFFHGFLYQHQNILSVES